ncbi:hypothetical protein [Hyphomicrobium sp. 1Nfss2.1]|uniref:hypothetical protein n=1 Tax=Hyphomicrobium sp. 1Nfss2.1 TaxID=3413936 RepID=UPI003C7D187E
MTKLSAAEADSMFASLSWVTVWACLFCEGDAKLTCLLEEVRDGHHWVRWKLILQQDLLGARYHLSPHLMDDSRLLVNALQLRLQYANVVGHGCSISPVAQP